MMKVQKGREHSHLFGNTRYCTHHMGVTLIEGGEWLVTEKAAAGAGFALRAMSGVSREKPLAINRQNKPRP